MTTGEQIRFCREVAGLTQYELSKKAGVGHFSISRFEDSHWDPTPDGLAKIATALGVTTGFLLDSESAARSLEGENDGHVAF